MSIEATGKFSIEKILHILLYPRGWSEAEVEQAKREAVDYIENKEFDGM